MTNPYSGLEHISSATDYLPAEEQIQANSPELTKGIMEVWRDTANQLDAERMISKRAQADYSDAYESYVNEQCARLELQEDLRKEKERKDLAIQELNGFKEQSQKQLEKLRRHRDELTGKVQNARKTSTNLNEWLEVFDKGDSQFAPIDILRDVARELNEELEVSKEEEETNEAN